MIEMVGGGRGMRLTGALLLLLGISALAGCSDNGGTDTPTANTPTASTNNQGYEAALLTPPKPKPDLSLPDTSGVMFNLQQATQGYVTLLYVGYTHCPDVCPLHMANIASALGGMDPALAERVKVVFITADPERDTPAVLRKWLDNFNPNFIGLVPSVDQLDAVTSALGMPPIAHEDLGNGDYGVSHAAFVLAFDANDNLARIGFLGGMEEDVYAHDLLKLAQEAPTSNGG